MQSHKATIYLGLAYHGIVSLLPLLGSCDCTCTMTSYSHLITTCEWHYRQWQSTVVNSGYCCKQWLFNCTIMTVITNTVVNKIAIVITCIYVYLCWIVKLRDRLVLISSFSAMNTFITSCYSVLLSYRSELWCCVLYFCNMIQFSDTCDTWPWHKSVHTLCPRKNETRERVSVTSTVLDQIK